MLNFNAAISLRDFFSDIRERKGKSACFCRITGYTKEIDEFLRRYYVSAAQGGAVLSGHLANPDEKQLALYSRQVGTAFRPDAAFISASLAKWIPNAPSGVRETLAAGMEEFLISLRAKGKSESILKNTCIKYMCWLYFAFGSVLKTLGTGSAPKILFEGEISYYELMFLSLLSRAGCDVVLLLCKGDASYAKLDPDSRLSCLVKLDGMKAFPPDFSLEKIRREESDRLEICTLYGDPPALSGCANAWMKGTDIFEEVKLPPERRGTHKGVFYNCFCRIRGVEDKQNYLKEAHAFHEDLLNQKRNVVLMEGELAAPTVEEIQTVQYGGAPAGIAGLLRILCGNIKCSPQYAELQKLMRKAFLDLMTGEWEKSGRNNNRMKNMGVHLICRIRKYIPLLFAHGRFPQPACLIRMGGCQSNGEALFLRFLARLPVDVLILIPGGQDKCLLSDPLLFEKKHELSLEVSKFPTDLSEFRIGTTAYYAERELDSLMFQDTGIYRDQQYPRANAMTMRTTYEEIKILWKEEARFRPNFEARGDTATIPVIFCKVSGVKDGNADAYWNSIRQLLKEDAVLISHAPHISPGAFREVQAAAKGFFQGGRLLKERIKASRHYPYALLRREMQEHILDKMQLLIDRRTIRGTMTDGAEYAIVATVLNLGKDISRRLQNFDFTKKNPKLLYVNAEERMYSLEDAIMAAFLNLAGFDVVFFVPTGYQCVEQFYNANAMETHQIGQYVYDMQIPDLSLPVEEPEESWIISKLNNMFKRG